MYLDADAGLLQFGSDMDYFGTAISDIPCQYAICPMVAATTQGATIVLTYRGQANMNQVGSMGVMSPNVKEATTVFNTSANAGDASQNIVAQG